VLNIGGPRQILNAAVSHVGALIVPELPLDRRGEIKRSLFEDLARLIEHDESQQLVTARLQQLHKPGRRALRVLAEVGPPGQDPLCPPPQLPESGGPEKVLGAPSGGQLEIVADAPKVSYRADCRIGEGRLLRARRSTLPPSLRSACQLPRHS